jgi:hypothetical protein
MRGVVKRHPITCKDWKGVVGKPGKVNNTKAYITNEETATPPPHILNGVALVIYKRFMYPEQPSQYSVNAPRIGVHFLAMAGDLRFASSGPALEPTQQIRWALGSLLPVHVESGS